MSIDSEAKGGKKRDETPRTSLYTRANITHTFFFDATATCNAKHVYTFWRWLPKKQEVDDFSSRLTGHTRVSCSRFLFIAWAELEGEEEEEERRFALSPLFFCYLCSFWTECYCMHGHTGIFGQICLFCASGSIAAMGIVLCVFLFYFWTGMGVKKWKWNERQILFCMCDEGRFLLFLFISYFFFHVTGDFYIGKARWERRPALRGFSFFFFQLSPFSSLSLSLSIRWKRLGMKIHARQ